MTDTLEQGLAALKRAGEKVSDDNDEVKDAKEQVAEGIRKIDRALARQ